MAGEFRLSQYPIPTLFLVFSSAMSMGQIKRLSGSSSSYSSMVNSYSKLDPDGPISDGSVIIVITPPVLLLTLLLLLALLL